MGFELTPRERRWFDAILVLAAVALTFIVLGYVGLIFATFADLIFIFFLAWLLAFMLSPAVTALRNAVPFLSRAGAVIVVYLLLFGAIVVLSVYLATVLVSSIGQLIANLPSIRQDLPGILAPWQERIDGLGLFQVDLVAQANTIVDNLSNYAAQLIVPLQQLAVASAGAVGNLLLVIILSLYMVGDRDRILAFLFRLVPRGGQAEARILEEAVARSFGGFLRGQAITGIIFAVITLAASLIFGLEYAAVTTAAAGVLMAIPFFGPFAAWIPPVLVAILFKPDAVLGTFLVVGIGWVVLLNVLQPRIMGDALRIHPIVVLASVFIGLKLAGVPGAIFGIPIAAVLSALFLHLLARPSEDGSVAMRAARRVGQREGRSVRSPREPDPRVDRDVEPDPRLAGGAETDPRLAGDTEPEEGPAAT